MDGCSITFGLWPHVIQHPSIGIFSYCVNKQRITNSISLLDAFVNYACYFVAADLAWKFMKYINGAMAVLAVGECFF